MRKRIMTIGKADMNLELNVQSIPSATRTVEGIDYEYVPGCGGSVAAVAFANFLVDSVFCGRIGDDENGERLLRYFNKCGVDTRFIVKDGSMQTGFATIINETHSISRKIYYPGANAKFGREELESGFMSYPDALYMKFELPDRDCVAASRYAKKQEIPVFIDGGPRKFELALELLENVEIFSPNEEEVYHYTDVYPSDPQSCLRACMALGSKLQAKYIVLKLGEKGSFIYDGKYYHVSPACDATFVDGNGAGDVFTAAMTAEYLRHGDIEAACTFANVASAMTISREGSFSAIPTRKEVEIFADSLGIKLL